MSYRAAGSKEPLAAGRWTPNVLGQALPSVVWGWLIPVRPAVPWHSEIPAHRLVAFASPWPAI